MSFIGHEDQVHVTATDVLALDDEQLAQYVRGQKKNNRYTYSQLGDLSMLPNDQKHDLLQKLHGAEMQITLDVEALAARLAEVASKPDSPSDLGLSRWQSSPRTPPESRDTIVASTPCRSWAYHDELIECGGRPACSTQELIDILADPTIRHEALLPWLSEVPEMGDHKFNHGGVAEMQRSRWWQEMRHIFHTQYEEWWAFRKWQSAIRKRDDREDSFSAFLAAEKRIQDRLGHGTCAFDATCLEAVQQKWRAMQIHLVSTGGQSFAAYKNATTKHLAAYSFTRDLQLKKNPQRQDAWTDWLEYLNYQQCHLERLAAKEKNLEQTFNKSWEKLLTVMKPSCNDAWDARGQSDVRVEPVTSLAEAFRERKTTANLIRDMKPFLRARNDVSCQRHRVKWAVEQAHLMEIERCQQKEIVKNSMRFDMNGTRKRRRDDAAEASPILPLKRTKHREISESGVRPPLRRSARLSARATSRYGG